MQRISVQQEKVVETLGQAGEQCPEKLISTNRKGKKEVLELL
ncbi:MAG: hypothetical protein R8P61_26680 [Bacteroidia bacterium]|nr:hypothetical protein [Bacteroidia bacterium]